jgi:hypothetical protein
MILEHNPSPFDSPSGWCIRIILFYPRFSQLSRRNNSAVPATPIQTAFQEGISAQEVFQAILPSLTTCGFPYMAAAMRWAEEVLQTMGKGE